MSRYAIEHPEYQVIVGWDEALETYFAQLEPSPGSDSEELLLWSGTSPGENQEVADIAQALKMYATIPSDVQLSLERDRSSILFGLVLGSNE